jgi:hypothetical protein
MLLKIVRRRWLATWPVILILVLLGPGLIAGSDPEFTASGSAVLLRSDPTAALQPPDPELAPRNPYAEFSAAVGVTAAVLVNLSSGEVFRDRVVAEGGNTNYTIEQEVDAPILLIEARAATAAKAVATVAAVNTALQSELAARQERFDVPGEERIVLEPVTVPTKAKRLETARNRLIVLLAAFGVVGVFISALLAESWAQGQARRRADRLLRAAAATANGDGGRETSAPRPLVASESRPRSK